MRRTILTVTLAAALSTLSTPPAAAQPYGGCDEAWQAPKSEGAEWCRDHGWTVRARYVIGPAGYLRYSSLPSCRFEDGSGQPVRGGNRNCSWNVHRGDGNGRGDQYLVVGPASNRRFIDLAGVR